MSGLEFQTVPIDFRGAMDQKTNKKLIPAGGWAELKNCAQAADFALRIRDGHSALVATANGNSLVQRNNELLVVAGEAAKAIGASGAAGSESTSATTVPGEIGFVTVEHQQLVQTGGIQTSPDCAHGRGHTCYVWIAADAGDNVTGVSVAVKHEESGSFVIQPVSMRTSATVFCPRVVYSAGCFFIAYRDGTTLYGRGITVGATNALGPLTGEVAVITDANFGSKNFDMERFGETEATDFGQVGVALPYANGVTSVVALTLVQTAGVIGLNAGLVNAIEEANLAFANLTGIGVCWMNTPELGQGGSFAIFATGRTGALAGTAGRVLNGNFATFAATFQVDATVSTTTAPTHVCAVGQAGTLFAVIFTDQQCEWAVGTVVAPVRRNVITSNNVTVSVGTAATFIYSALFVPSATTPSGPQGPFLYGKPFQISEANFISGTAAAPVFADGSLMLSMCIMENYQGLAANVVNNNQQSTMFLLDGGTAKVVGKALYGRFGVPATSGNTPRVGTPSGSPQIVDVTTGGVKGWASIATESTHTSFESGRPVTPTGISRLTWIPQSSRCIDTLQRSLSSVQLGPVSYVAGGSLTQYDGLQTMEAAFPLFPEGVSVVNVAGGGSVDAGAHAVCAVYEWIDGSGQRHQSAPSTPVSVTSAALDSIRVRTPTSLLSQRALTIALYMTEVNSLTLKRVTTIAAPIANSTATMYVTTVITSSDASIAGNELLYTQPLLGESTLANVAPNPCTALAVHQNRLWLDRSDTEGGYAFSQELISGVGLQFNETLSGVTPADGGRIVGIDSMDDKLIILCERKLFYVLGSGPTPSGGFSNYSKPIEIPSDVGCSQRRSILSMPLGIIFLSPKGFYLLGRDLSVRDIGNGVDVLSNFRFIESAVLMETEQECRFGTTGYTLIFSYVPGTWSYSVVVANTGSTVGTYAALDARYWPSVGAYVTVSADHGLNADVSGQQYDSPGACVPDYFGVTARTSFIHLSALEGFQRVRRLNFTTSPSGSVTGDFDLTVDFDDLYQNVDPSGAPGSYVATFDLSALSSNSTVLDFRHKLRRQKCKSVAFTFSAEGGTGASNIAGLEALALEIGVKRGSNKLPATNSIT